MLVTLLLSLLLYNCLLLDFNFPNFVVVRRLSRASIILNPHLAMCPFHAADVNVENFPKRTVCYIYIYNI